MLSQESTLVLVHYLDESPIVAGQKRKVETDAGGGTPTNAPSHHVSVSLPTSNNSPSISFTPHPLIEHPKTLPSISSSLEHLESIVLEEQKVLAHWRTLQEERRRIERYLESSVHIYSTLPVPFFPYPKHAPFGPMRFPTSIVSTPIHYFDFHANEQAIQESLSGITRPAESELHHLAKRSRSESSEESDN